MVNSTLFFCLFVLQIKNGKVLHFTSDAGIAEAQSGRNIPEVYVADGHWHTFLIGKNGTAYSVVR